MSDRSVTECIPEDEPPPSDGMRWIPGGTFRMGDDNAYPEEAPAHTATVSGFWIDEYVVTNADFAAFVTATGYRTVAERPLDPAAYPGADPGLLIPGSSVFFMPTRPANLVAFEDVAAYATWASKALPTEAEWEFAARGGLESAMFAWGNEFTPDGRYMANTWQGPFPYRDDGLDGFVGRSPVGSFPPNGYGLYDMIGNVWEWTADWYSDHHTPEAEGPCCVPRNPQGSLQAFSYELAQRATCIPRKVIKGGSYLCAPNYCQRYRPAARHPQMIDTGTSHIGFRCISRPD